MSPRPSAILSHACGLLFALQTALPCTSYAQVGQAGFAFEAYGEPILGILSKAPFRGWVSGLGVGYKITPEYSLWLSALAGPGRRPRDIVGDAGPRDDYGLLRLSARRIIHLDSTVSFSPLIAFRISTFLLPDGATTINGRGFEVGGDLTLQLSEHFEVGTEAAFTYDSYQYRSGPVPAVTSFAGSDVALRLVIRFHPTIP